MTPTPPQAGERAEALAELLRQVLNEDADQYFMGADFHEAAIAALDSEESK